MPAQSVPEATSVGVSVCCEIEIETLGREVSSK